MFEVGTKFLLNERFSVQKQEGKIKKMSKKNIYINRMYILVIRSHS